MNLLFSPRNVKPVVDKSYFSRAENPTRKSPGYPHTLLISEIVVAPPALYLLHVQSALKAPLQVSAQNCFTEASGAFTGEISPNQLKDAEVHWVILGHSERRSMFGDTDKLVADKVKAAVAAGLGVIACVGETLEERESNKTKEVVERQLGAIAAEVPESVWS